MADFDQIIQQEPEPTIVIRCQKKPLSGAPGQYTLDPALSFTNMPGGWRSIFAILQECIRLVVLELMKEASKGGNRVEVVPALPGELVKH